MMLVNERGISTGLESIPFDEIIREAGVSRTSAYRRWPQRDRFYGDVLVELARGASLPSPEGTLADPVARTVLKHAHRLDSPQEHRDLVVELLRMSIGADFEVVIKSPEWHTYRILLASYQGIVDEGIRRDVTETLAAADQRAVDVRARIYAQFTALLGYRLTPPLSGPDGFEFMSRATGASMMGVLARHSLGDRSIELPRKMRAFGTTTTATWTPGVYMVTASVLSYIEADPGVRWDRQRIDDLMTAIRGLGPSGI